MARGEAAAGGHAAARAATHDATAPSDWRWRTPPKRPQTRGGGSHVGPAPTDRARSRLAAPSQPLAPPCRPGDESWRRGGGLQVNAAGLCAPSTGAEPGGEKGYG